MLALEEQPSDPAMLALFNRNSTVGEPLSELEESLIIIEAIQEASMSKFLPEDVLPFERIIEDVFPGITVSKTQHLALEVMRPHKQYQVPWRWNLCGFKYNGSV